MLLVRVWVLTRVEQALNEDMTDAAKRKITQVLQEGHGADKGVAITADSSCLFFDFETCEEIRLFGNNVRFPSLHDVA